MLTSSAHVCSAVTRWFVSVPSSYRRVRCFCCPSLTQLKTWSLASLTSQRSVLYLPRRDRCCCVKAPAMPAIATSTCYRNAVCRSVVTFWNQMSFDGLVRLHWRYKQRCIRQELPTLGTEKEWVINCIANSGQTVTDSRTVATDSL